MIAPPKSQPVPPGLADIADELQRTYGVHLYLRVAPVDDPGMDWREVLLPPDCDKWSPEVQTAILLHEWGHRIVSPISPRVWLVWKKVAMRAGLGPAQAQSITNLYADALVDRFFLLSSKWKEVFARGMAGYLGHCSQRPARKEGVGQRTARLVREKLRETMEGKFKAAGEKRFSRQAVEFLPWFFGKRKIQQFGGLSDLALPSNPVKVSPRDQRAAEELSSEVWAIVYRDDLSHAERIRRLSRLFLDCLPAEGVSLLWRVHLITGREKGWNDDLDRLWQEIFESGLAQEDLSDALDEKQYDRLRLRAERLKMYAKVVPVVEKFLRAHARTSVAGYRRWAPGRPTRELDAVASLQRSSLLIPGVTTLRRRHEHRGALPGRGAGAVVLVVDDSGSTEGDCMLRQKEACFSVIAAARAFRDPVGLVAFGSQVSKTHPLTSRYDEVEEQVCRLSSESGGTELAPALKAALAMVSSYPAFSLMVMTDSFIHDERQVFDLLRALPGKARMVGFCFTDLSQANNNLGDLAGRQVRLLAVSPDKPFCETALEEIYG